MRLFLGFGQVPYIGAPFTTPIKLAGISGQTVPLLFNWISYGAATAKPNINVLVDIDNAVCKAIDQIRSIYIDNLGSQNPVYVYFPDTGYTCVAKANSEGWYPVYTNTKKLWVVGEGFLDGSIPTTFILLSNIALPASVNTELDQAVSLWKSSPLISRGSSIYNSSFGVPALGDQLTATGQMTLTFPTTIPLWNSPYSSGFLYIQQIQIVMQNVAHNISPAIGQFVLESTGVAGTLLNCFFVAPPTTNVVYNQIYLDLKGMNLKLDATQIWQVRNITSVAQGNIQVYSSFTQSPN